ncbi:hypothetical protein N658DRAFT_497195, partial [Parathielavia hyrcaniae]
MSETDPYQAQALGHLLDPNKVVEEHIQVVNNHIERLAAKHSIELPSTTPGFTPVPDIKAVKQEHTV